MNKIERYENSLVEYAIQQLKEIPEVELYGNKENGNGRVGIVPFNISGVYHDIVARALSQEAGIAVRSGCFCAHPYVSKLLKVAPGEMRYYAANPEAPKPGLIRVSFGLYNHYKEIDILAVMLDKISKNKDYYIQKYGSSL
jgi:selenocysteine lyase/cysteine desulfurase